MWTTNFNKSFSKWRIFSNGLLFSGKTAFLPISADFVIRFEKLFFHLKTLQTRMQIDVNNFFVAQMVPEIYAKNTSFKISWICFFVTHCNLVGVGSMLSGAEPRNQSLVFRTILQYFCQYQLYFRLGHVQRKIFQSSKKFI